MPRTDEAVAHPLHLELRGGLPVEVKKSEAGRATTDEVNRLRGKPNSQRADFNESRRELDEQEASEWSSAGDDESVAHYPPTDSVAVSSRRVTSAPGGAVRDGFFKKRDYE